MFDPNTIIQAVGVIGITAIIFCESGLFFGFFLPGDSLLFTAGILASQNLINFKFVLIGCIIAAILGNIFGYWSGKKWGRRLFERDAGMFFKKKRIKQAEDFYEKHGKYTIIIARFIPIIRTFAPIVAGIGKMNYPVFFTFSILSGVLWATVVLSIGYFFGGLIPNIEAFIIPISVAIIFVSFIPIIFKYIRLKFKKSV